MKRTKRPANGPGAIRALRDIGVYRRDPLTQMVGSFERYGDCYWLPLLGGVLLTRSPVAARHVLQERASRYTKGFEYERVRPLLGQGLLTSEGALWRRQRRLAQPAFHKERIRAMATTMADVAGRSLGGLARAADAGEPVDVAAEMSALTLRIAGLTLFSMDLDDSRDTVAGALQDSMDVLERRVDTLFPLPLWVPTPTNRRFVNAIRALDRVVFRIIETRREAESAGAAERHGAEDLLGMLMSAEDAETGERMSDRQLRDELLTLMLAGHETTALALAFTLHLLARHPEARARLEDEVDEVLGGRQPTQDDLPALPWTRQVLEESMRLYPPAWGISRRALEDDVVDGHAIPAGTTVAVMIYHLHRNPSQWDDPDSFRPERFDAEAPARERGTYLPFAFGPRMCIGAQFAMVEAQLTLAQIVQRFRLEPASDATPALQPSITLRPMGGLMLKVQRREGAPAVALAG